MLCIYPYVWDTFLYLFICLAKLSLDLYKPDIDMQKFQHSGLLNMMIGRVNCWKLTKSSIRIQWKLSNKLVLCISHELYHARIKKWTFILLEVTNATVIFVLLLITILYKCSPSRLVTWWRTTNRTRSQTAAKWSSSSRFWRIPSRWVTKSLSSARAWWPYLL